MVFTFGPSILLSVGVVGALLMVLGEFKPALRGIRLPFIILVLSLIACSLATAFTLTMYPQSNCPSAPTSSSPAQATNAP
jgi:hypothetical protein